MSRVGLVSVTRQAWFAVLAGLVVGVLALVLSSLLDLVTTDLAPGELAPYLPEYMLAGLIFGVFALPAFRACLTNEVDTSGAVKRSVFAGTAAVTLFAAVTVLIAPKFPVRWLLYFYAISTFLDWLAWRFIVKVDLPALPPPSRAARIAAYVDSVPHAPFVVAGLCLLALTPFYLFANQQTPAERVANWAFGMLALGVATALLEVFVPDQLKLSNRLRAEIGGALLVGVLFVVGYASESAHTKAEDSFLVDVQPSYLATVVTNQDLVISDSPKLRLGNIPDMTAHLDISPDQRGLALWDDLTRALQGKRNVYWVNVPDDSHDTQQVLASYLQSNGCLDDTPGTILPVKPYELRSPLTSPKVLPPLLAGQVADAFISSQVDFGAIQMTGFNYELKVCSHDAIAVAARWTLPQPTSTALKLYLALTDSKGRLIQSQDLSIEDVQQRTSDQLPAGSRILGYYLIVVPFGTPPGDYQLAAGVYNAGSSQRLHVNSATGVAGSAADLVTLGKVQVYRAQNLNSDPYKTLQDSKLVQSKTDLIEGLRLAAYGVNTQSVLPGEDVSLTARWRGLVDGMPAYSIRVSLQQAGQTVAQVSGAPADGSYPTNQWRSNEVVVDHWDLPVPPDTKGGLAQLQIGVDGGRTIDVADINIAPITHTFQLPSMGYPATATFGGVGNLIGYDLESTSVSPNNPVPLTLYWVSAVPSIDKNLTVFAQLLASDGHLIAQSDSAPADGQRPTRGWVKGEVIVDRHTLNFTDKSYNGQASLIVGMYDPTTGERVPVQGSADSFARLATPVKVTSP